MIEGGLGEAGRLRSILRSISQLASAPLVLAAEPGDLGESIVGLDVVIQMPGEAGARTLLSVKRSASVMGCSWSVDGNGRDVVNGWESGGFRILVREPEQDFGPGDQKQEREPVVRRAWLELEQGLDRALVQSPRFQPPHDEPPKRVGDEARQIIVRRRDALEDASGNGAERAVKGLGLFRRCVTGTDFDDLAQLGANGFGDPLDQNELGDLLERSWAARQKVIYQKVVVSG